jgi:hypothetical protein
MYHLNHRPAKRMEGRLPSGTTTGSILIGSLYSSNISRYEGMYFSAFIVLLGVASSLWRVFTKYFLPYRFMPGQITLFAMQPEIRRLWIQLYSVPLTRFMNQFLTLINMGADPILMSVKRWHGSHHSNQGGKIQCQ